MAATIVAFVCEDHQDYELMEPSTTIHNRKSEKEKTVFSPLTKLISTYPSSTAQGGGGSFKNRKPIGDVGCCESRMAERIH